MKGNLVIVESPAKAKKIQGYLGEDFVVKSCYGHIRDLQENNLSIDIEDGFKPQYVIPSDKTKVVADLKKEASKAATVWLASDEDREGEAIAWHLSDVLELPEEKIRRIAFHEITKPAILEAVEHPRGIDMNLVSAQQARRVLDRLVGFELSPVLWKKIQPKLSAGRVQSVALRLVVDREREIEAFGSEQYYKVDAVFIPEGGTEKIKATLDTKFQSLQQARDFLERSKGAQYGVRSIVSKEGSRTPAAPFTTSTLQQEAVRKLGMSVSQTMQVAQKLYEEGLITYMRTDSVNLSSLAVNTAKKYICENFSEAYSHPRQYRTKSKGAQEAHEAIRPTYIQNPEISGTPAEKKLYSLIWKRTVASQMSDASLMNTTVQIGSPSFPEQYVAVASKVLFDGFLRLYMESSDEVEQESLASLPDIGEGSVMLEKGVVAECKYTAPPQRYNQASLVHKLEELGIGRPSTYASIISTLVKGRGYIVESDKEGREVKVRNLHMDGGEIKEKSSTIRIGAEKRKLLPQDIGIMVSDFLVSHFPDIVDYGFTADVEKNFDTIAEGKLKWDKVIGDFYGSFSNSVKCTMQSSDYSRLEREIGIDPSDGRMITARYGQYGPFVQKGEGEGRVFASLAKGQIIESLTLEDALKLFQLPRNLGKIDGVDLVVAKGRFGPYLKYGERNVALGRGVDPLKVTLEQATAILRAQAEKPASRPIAQWGDIQVLEGTYGPYIKVGTSNYRIPNGTDAASLTEESVKAIIASSEPTSKKRRYFKKK